MSISDGGASRWCDNNGIDDTARQRFLALSHKDQDSIRRMGTVWNTANPSRALMGRIRDLVSLRSAEEKKQFLHDTSMIQVMHPRHCKIAVLIYCSSKSPSYLPKDVLQATLRSISEELVLPLQSKGLEVILIGTFESMAQDRLSEIQEVWQQLLPPDALMEVRATAEPFGGLNAFIRCLDVTPVHWRRLPFPKTLLLFSSPPSIFDRTCCFFYLRVGLTLRKFLVGVHGSLPGLMFAIPAAFLAIT